MSVFDDRGCQVPVISHRLCRSTAGALCADHRGAGCAQAVAGQGSLRLGGHERVLHCLPGPIEHKASAVQSVAAVLADGGVAFGGTIVVDAPAHTRLSRALIRSNNRRGIFGNESDTMPAVRSLFEAEFQDVEVHLRGTMAVFTARAPR